MNELGICEQDMYEQGMNEQEVNGQGISELGRLEIYQEIWRKIHIDPIILKILKHMIAQFAAGRNFAGVFALNLPLICRKKHLLT